MPRFSDEEERKIYDIARQHLQKTDSNVTETCMASLVWRKESGLVVVVWANKVTPAPEWDKNIDSYYEQYNYHVALKVLYKDGKRFLRVVDAHAGGLNVWNGPFKCGSCEFSLR